MVVEHVRTTSWLQPPAVCGHGETELDVGLVVTTPSARLSSWGQMLWAWAVFLGPTFVGVILPREVGGGLRNKRIYSGLPKPS